MIRAVPALLFLAAIVGCASPSPPTIEVAPASEPDPPEVIDFVEGLASEEVEDAPGEEVLDEVLDTDDVATASVGDVLADLREVETASACAFSDVALATRWQDAPESLGSISLGFTYEGRIINAEPFPSGGEDEAWTVILPSRAWATSETIAYVVAAARQVRAVRPDAHPLRVNGISLREGGWLRPHRTHQNGRDVDLGFYYPTPEAVRCRACEKHMDVPANWELVKALVSLTDVEVILVDRAVQRVLIDYALSIGEDPTWIDSLFRAGRRSLIKHARRHRDHFHVRFYNPCAQELGRRVAPLLAQRPDENLRMYRVRNGDNLSMIAYRNNSSVRAIQKANRMRGTFLSVGRVLRVPMRGPCTRCPVPPPVEVPARRVPPLEVATATTSAAVVASSDGDPSAEPPEGQTGDSAAPGL
ncbi:MAG: penicillin-insensitive murein endopeptidase [Deltaproteobacteria bacterium]